MPFDPAQNYLEKIPEPLDALFNPESIAIIGAKDTPGSVARTIQLNLVEGGFSGTIYPVNPKREEVLGLKSYPKVPEPVDLAVIVTPAKTVPPIIGDCVEMGVRSAIVISAGFKELGEPGAKLEREILAKAQSGAMPIIGPNCLGVINPISRLNASFSKGMALEGNVAFLSQSGALCTAVLDWSFQEKLGFSAFVSVGSMLDVDWGDLIRYFGNDPHTSSILIYMETVGDPRSFLSAAREVALRKPIIVIKPGRTAAAAKAAASHTGSLVGNDQVFEAALDRVGVMRVDTISELFNFAEVLAKQPLPKGPNLGIITNAGGPAVIATDAAIADGAVINELSEETLKNLNAFLPEAWSHNNPVDILGDAKAETYAKTMEVMCDAPEFDGLLTILTPQDMTEPTETAQALAHRTFHKPILASWMGADAVRAGVYSLNAAGIPTYEFPDNAASTFAKMWHHHVNLQALYEPAATTQRIEPDAYQRQIDRKSQARAFAETGRNLLTEEESKSLLKIYSIPTVETHIATSAEEAVSFAEKIGFPVVLKLHSMTITHKTDVGGVLLNLLTPEAVEKAFKTIEGNVASDDFGGVTVQKMIKNEGYELIIGSSIDPQFGPVILFGSGGQMVEVYQDTAIGLPPLSPISAKHLIDKTKIAKALEGVRGRKAVNIDKLVDILMRFSKMIVENPWIEECDINPLLVSEDQMIALDARVTIAESNIPKTALRPYPLEYCTAAQLKDGTTLSIRPIKPDDQLLLQAFHTQLSDYTVHQRYLQFLSLSKRIAHERLANICYTDFTHEFVLVAELQDEDRIVGIIRLSLIPSTQQGQFFIVIDDTFQNKGLGKLFMEAIIDIAHKEGIPKIVAKILPENKGMVALCERFEFTISKMQGEPFLLAERDLSVY